MRNEVGSRLEPAPKVFVDLADRLALALAVAGAPVRRIEPNVAS